MESDSQKRIRKALRVCMRPIAEFLLRAGVGYREFEEASRLAFVETAINKFGVRGRATNISRVAAMTGMSRKEISRLRESLQSESSVDEVRTSPAGLVLAGWYTDKGFIDREGNPALLSYDGAAPSFVELVGRYAGDVPAGAVRAELKRSGSIEEGSDGSLRALHRHFVPSEVLERLSNSVEIMLHGLAATIAHNSNQQQSEPGFIERIVYSDSLRESAVADFRLMARERAQELLENLDDWLAERDIRAVSPAEKATDRRVGLGVFYYEGPGSADTKADG